MRSDLEIKYMLSVALQKTVRKAFLKRGFDDSFSKEEMIKIKEIDKFLRDVSEHKDNPMFTDEQIKYICISFQATYTRRNGERITTFCNKFINQKDLSYKKIPYYVAKSIFRLSTNRHIEVFFAVNSFAGTRIKEKMYIPQRKRDNVVSSCCLFTDIDLPSELVKLGNEEVLRLLKANYQELFNNLEPSYIVRSGGGVHMYYLLEQSMFLKSEETKEFYTKGLKSLQKIFEDYGGDCRCVDMTRILRVPLTINRKPKYGPDGREVSIIYKSGTKYEDVFSLTEKLNFLLQGGLLGTYQSVLDDMFFDYPPEQEEETILEEITEKAHRERKAPVISKKDSDYVYKGIKEYYNFYGEKYYQNQDLLIWIQNRKCHEGMRNNLLWFFNYNWYVFCGVKDVEEMISRSERVNELLAPQLDHSELVFQVRHNFHTLCSKLHYNKAIRNTTIQSYLHFTEEEKHCLRGLYFETYEEYLTERRFRKMEYSRERYTRELEEQGLIRRTEKKQLTRNILHENPLMSYKEFYEKTGLSKSTYDVYKRELGNSKEKHFELQREYFLQPFYINPNISCTEYVKQCNCSSSTYRKYRKIYRDSNK